MAKYDAAENLLIKIGEILIEKRNEKTKQPVEPKPTIREKFLEMYSANTLNNFNPSKPRFQQENIANKIKYVILKPKETDNVVLQQMEEIKRDKEETQKTKEEMDNERKHIESQQQQLRSAFDEAKRNKII